MDVSRHTVIIGGGGIGSAIAFFLSSMAQPGKRITVIERDPTYRFASSSLSASSLRQQFSTAVNVRLSQFGYSFLESLGEGRHSPVGLEPRGYLFLGRSDQAAILRERTQNVRALGGAVEELDPSQLQNRYPWINCDEVIYASRGMEAEGWFDGYMLQQLYRSRARAAGVEYVQGEVVGLEIQGSKAVAVELAGGQRVSAADFVIASGPWSATVARLAGVELPIRARRRSVFVVSCPTALPDFPILIDTTGVYVRPEQKHYLCMVSPSAAADHDDLPLDPDFTLFEDQIWPALAERIPAFESLRIERAWAGYYEFNTADHNGLVGQVGPDNLYVAAGFSGHGLMHSAGVGRGVAELLRYGEYRTLDLAPLSPARLRSGQLITEDAVY